MAEQQWLDVLKADRTSLGPLPILGQEDYWRFGDRLSTKARVDLAAFSDVDSCELSSPVSSLEADRVFNALLSLTGTCEEFRMAPSPSRPRMVVRGFIILDEQSREAALRSVVQGREQRVTLWLSGRNTQDGALKTMVTPSVLEIGSYPPTRPPMQTIEDALDRMRSGRRMSPIAVLRLAVSGLLSVVRGMPLDPDIISRAIR